ncbi:MAG: class I SAM-dependent methyltransferase [Thermoanaerobaculia bacterium]
MLEEPPEIPKTPLWRGSDARLFAAALRIRLRQESLQGSFPDPDSEEFYFWVMNHGLRERPKEVKAFMPQLPRRSALRRTFGNRDFAAFLNVGSETTKKLLALLRSAGLDPFAPRRVLDFGCGCARVLRFLAPLGDRLDLWGCDIDRRAIAYCREEIGRARFFSNRPEPPLLVADASYDWMYSISVLTHLSRPLHDAWIGEMRRVLAPGGFATISIHGARAWERMRSDPALRREMLIQERDLGAADEQWSREGFAFLSHVTPKAYAHDEPYGLVFLRPEVLPTLWPGFEVIGQESGALSDWQDLILVRRADLPAATGASMERRSEV